MPINIAIIVFLCSLVLLLLYQRQKLLSINKHNNQTKKIVQLLQAYPVHEYTMPHMLERCLVMLFSAPKLDFLAAGVFFIYKDKQLNLSAQRGFDLLSESQALGINIAIVWFWNRLFIFKPLNPPPYWLVKDR